MSSAAGGGQRFATLLSTWGQGAGCRPGTAFGDDFTRHHSKGQPDAERENYEIVEIPNYRDEIWNEVDGAYRVSENAGQPPLGVCGRSGMAVDQLQCTDSIPHPVQAGL